MPLFRCVFGATHLRTHGCDCAIPSPAEEWFDPYPEDNEKIKTPRLPNNGLGSHTEATWSRRYSMDNYKVEFYQREDKKWAWRMVARNGNIVATDGGQGYENLRDAFDTLHNISRGFSHETIKGFVAAGGTA